MKRAYCVNLGCSENKLDGALISRYLATNEWEVTDDPATADLLIVNSCGFTEDTEKTSLAAYHDLLAIKQPHARVIFAGCLPAINRQAVCDAGYTDVLVTPRSLRVLDSVIHAVHPIESAATAGCVPHSADHIGPSFTFRFPAVQEMLQRLASGLAALPFAPLPRWLWQFLFLPNDDDEFVRISAGSLNHCTFCAIPRAKGRTKSVPPPVVVNLVRAAVRRGKRNIALSCDELASYGQDIGTDIVALLDQLTRLPGDFHLILRNVHPEWMLKYWAGLAPIFERDKISYLIMPVQSGSNRILRRMERHHTAEEFEGLVREIRRVAPRVVIRTHVMVGFPGETDQDFAETCRMMARIPVDSFHVLPYSERRFTPAVDYADKVPAARIHARARRMKLLELANYLRPSQWAPLRPAAHSAYSPDAAAEL